MSQLNLEVVNINLMRAEVVGLQYYNYARFAQLLRIGDALQLTRERLNEHDRAAIAVYFMGEKMGFIAKESNKILSILQDHEVPLEAFIVEHNEKASIYKGDGRLMVNIYMPYTFVVEE